MAQLTHSDMQDATNRVISAANMARAVYKFPPVSPLGAYRTTEKQTEAVSQLVEAREQYRTLSQQFVDQGETRGNHYDAMLYLDKLINKHLGGYDAAFCAMAPDYNGGEIDWFAEMGKLPQVDDLSPEEQREYEEQQAQYRQQLIDYPPIGWGRLSPTYIDRVTRWRSRPIEDRIRDPRPRDIRINVDTAIEWSAE